MKITLEKIEVDEGRLEAIFKLKGHLEGIREIYSSQIQHKVFDLVADELAKQLLLEKGPAILNEISNNQIINAVIMRVASGLVGRDDR